MPSAACHIQAKLGAFNAGAFDLVAACSGFVYGANVAWQFVRSGRYRHVLVVGAECLSRATNYEDRTSCILFGDGAGAAVFSAVDDGGASDILFGSMGADGRGADIMTIPAGGSRKPACAETVAAKEHYIVVRGRETYKFAVQKMADLIAEGLSAAALSPPTSDGLSLTRSTPGYSKAPPSASKSRWKTCTSTSTASATLPPPPCP